MTTYVGAVADGEVGGGCRVCVQSSSQAQAPVGLLGTTRLRGHNGHSPADKQAIT